MRVAAVRRFRLPAAPVVISAIPQCAAAVFAIKCLAMSRTTRGGYPATGGHHPPAREKKFENSHFFLDELYRCRIGFTRVEHWWEWGTTIKQEPRDPSPSVRGGPPAGSGNTPEIKVVDLNSVTLDLSQDTWIKVAADSKKGFHFPYYLFMPKGIDPGAKGHLFVETNNTGTTSDDFQVHDDAAARLVRDSHATRIARGFGAPLLVPVFPRPRDHRQLDAFRQKAAFRFLLQAQGHDDAKITEQDLRGNCSGGHGAFQRVVVGPPSAELEKLASGVTYSLVPVEQCAEYTWQVKAGVQLIRP